MHNVLIDKWLLFRMSALICSILPAILFTVLLLVFSVCVCVCPLTRLKSARKVMRVPSVCLNSTLMMSRSLSDSKVSAVIWPSFKRTSTFSSEHTLTGNKRAKITTPTRSEVTKLILGYISTNRKAGESRSGVALHNNSSPCRLNNCNNISQT